MNRRLVPATATEEMPAGWTVDGPYMVRGDIWPSFTVRAPDRIVASVYAVDRNIERGEREANAIARMLSAAPTPGEDMRIAGEMGE